MRQIVFIAEAHPGWRYQWCDLPAAALARRGLTTRVVTAAQVAAGDWPPGSIVVAMSQAAVLPSWPRGFAYE
jgi:hypothetical protein